MTKLSRETMKSKVLKSLCLPTLLALTLVQYTSPVFAQYQLEAEQDSLLPPEVVPLDPQAARSLAEKQAQARQAYQANSANNGYNSGFSNDDSSNSNQMASNYSGMQNSRQARQEMMNSLMGQENAMPNMGNNMVPGLSGNNNSALSANTTTSEWIVPGQNNDAGQMAYGNVTQTQQLTAPSPNPTVRRDIRRTGISHAISGLAGFGAGALVGTMIRRPNSLWGLGMTGAMMTGFGARNAFRF